MRCKQCQVTVKKGNIFCNSSCAATYNNKRRKHSLETRKKIAESVKKNPSGFVKTRNFCRGGRPPAPTKECVCQECGNIFRARLWKKRLYCSVDCSNKNKWNPNSTRVHRSIYKGFQMDSGAELVFAKELDRRNVKWIKNDQSINQAFIYSLNGKERRYRPDFYLPDHDIWVEIKGRRYIREGDEIRRKSVGKHVELIISNDMKTRLPEFFGILGDL